MPMNLVIQEKRKELGLTQEQVAAYLNVSTPAVSKWEKGTTSPDISLLPQLARLLKIDLNTLFCFSENMTAAEISYFCQEIAELVQSEGFAAGFETAAEKLQEYPHSETLLYALVFQMDGHLLMSGMPEAEKTLYETELAAWYSKLTESTDDKIRNSASYMLAGKYIRSAEYEKAQEILDAIPDREDIISSMTDKLMLQVSIYQKQEQTELAIQKLQYALLTAVQKVQLILSKLVDAELSADHCNHAKKIAVISSQFPVLFDLWEYSSFVDSLQIAMAEEDADTCVGLLRKLLNLITKPWNPAVSPLFYHIKPSSDLSQMLPALLSDMEKSLEYKFLRENKDYQKLLAEYKANLR